MQSWLDVVRERNLERSPGESLAQILADLGPMPEAEAVDDRAFWVAGLINPLPGLNIPPVEELRMEIRPAVLAAQSTQERVEVVRSGLLAAVERLRDR